MNFTDPIADLLTRIRNGCRAKKDVILVPASRLKAGIVKVLRDEGFISSFSLMKEEGKPWIKIELRYDSKGQSIINNIQRMSRPGLRKYIKYSEVTKVRNGAGISILSTSKGVLTGNAARSAQTGGEYLCEVW